MTALAHSYWSEIAMGLQISLLKGSLFSFRRIYEGIVRYRIELIFEFLSIVEGLQGVGLRHWGIPSWCLWHLPCLPLWPRCCQILVNQSTLPDIGFSLEIFCGLGSFQPHRCFPEDRLQELAEVLRISVREISHHCWNDMAWWEMCGRYCESSNLAAVGV